MTSSSYSANIARKSGSNFYWSFFFLPSSKRRGLMTLYAFSRLVDDAVDEAADIDTARRELRLWKSRLDFCFNGKEKPASEIDHPILAEMKEVIRNFSFSRKTLEDLLLGVEMDLDKNRYFNFGELEKYCYHVAGTIGLLCNSLFGKNDAAAREYAVLLGTAFQLTNIIRDVGQDARRGRIYIPREDLKKFGVSETEILEGRPSTSFQELMLFQAIRAEDFFRRALIALPFSQRKKILPAEMMTAFYRSVLNKVRREGFPVFEKKVTLSKPKKIALVLQTLWKSL